MGLGTYPVLKQILGIIMTQMTANFEIKKHSESVVTAIFDEFVFSWKTEEKNQGTNYSWSDTSSEEEGSTSHWSYQ